MLRSAPQPSPAFSLDGQLPRGRPQHQDVLRARPDVRAVAKARAPSESY